MLINNKHNRISISSRLFSISFKNVISEIIGLTAKTACLPIQQILKFKFLS